MENKHKKSITNNIYMRWSQGFTLLISLAFVASIDSGPINSASIGSSSKNNNQISVACDSEFTLFIDEKFMGEGKESNRTYTFYT